MDRSGDRRLTYAMICKLLGIERSTWRAYLARPLRDPDNPLPEKIPFEDGDGRDRRVPEMWESDVLRWHRNRTGPGKRTDLKGAPTSNPDPK